MLRPVAILAISCVVLAGCESDGEPFLPLPELCPQRTEALCAARAYACESVDSSCQNVELARCEELVDALVQEARLSYGSVAAARVRRDEQAALDNDEPPFPVASYFQRGLAEGADCERDSQCETGSCGPDSGQCESAPVLSLCDPE